jgi:hypothetical protein
MISRLLLVFALAVLAGCSTARDWSLAQTRPFDFHHDTFAYANETVWEYELDQETGRMQSRRREEPPSYSHHCFVMARAARQFWQHARFEPSEPPTGPADYQRLVRQVCSRNPRLEASSAEPIVIPGYRNLNEFSRNHEALLKIETGKAWESYFQRGNWRMVFPFSRKHQDRTARRLALSLQSDQPAIVHVIRFPALTINHALLLFSVDSRQGELRFNAYDPNDPGKPIVVAFDHSSRRFYLDQNSYFAGGKVSIYEVYRGAWY